MSRYSPTVTPEYFGTNGSELAAALTQMLHERRATQEANDAHATATGTYVANGGRYGQAPTRQESLELPTDAGIPDSLAGAFDAAQRGTPPPGQHPMWGGGIPGGAGTDQGFQRRPLPSGGNDPGFQERPAAGEAEPAPGGALAGALQARQGGQPAPPALTHGGGAPGSFQPGLGGFAPAMPAGSGGAAGAPERPRGPSVSMSVPDERYVQTDPEHYVDMHQTRQGQALAQAMAVLEGRNAGAYDRAVLGADTRRDVAHETNTTRREMNDDRIASGDDRTADQIASRERIAARSDATRRLTASLRAANGGRSITPTAKEANAHKAAAALLANYGGDYNQALDALEHSPEGQELAQSGVTRRHLYVALGQATTAEERQNFTAATGDQRATFSTPTQAAAKVGATRRALGAGRAPAARTRPNAFLPQGGAGGAPANFAAPIGFEHGAAAAAPAIDAASVTDNEAAAAYAAGARTDEEILHHVARARGAAKKTPP